MLIAPEPLVNEVSGATTGKQLFYRQPISAPTDALRKKWRDTIYCIQNETILSVCKIIK